MEPFTQLTAVAAPLDQANVDTDQLTPARFMGRGRGDRYHEILFHDLRFDEAGQERRDFVLNQPPYREARILVADTNFGCGSSRESAVWALLAYGFRAVIAPSFGDIFRSNAAKNGLLAAVLDESRCDALRAQLRRKPGAALAVDLEVQTVTDVDGAEHRFDFDAFEKSCLLRGIDELGLTLELEDEIRAYEVRHRREMHWLYGDGAPPRV